MADHGAIVRGQVISLKNQEFILAARATGVATWRSCQTSLCRTHSSPSSVRDAAIPSVMLLEAFSPFWGGGAGAVASWGSLSADGIQTSRSSVATALPGITMAVTLFSLNFLGDGLRDALDPQMRKS